MTSSIFGIIKNKRLFTAFTALFIFAWFFCSAHISFSPHVAQASSEPDTHQQSPVSHADGSTKVCIDHAPTQNVSRSSNDVSNTPVVISNSTSDIVSDIQKVSGFNSDFIRDGDHLSMRYSFLIHNKFLI